MTSSIVDHTAARAFTAEPNVSNSLAATTDIDRRQQRNTERRQSFLGFSAHVPTLFNQPPLLPPEAGEGPSEHDGDRTQRSSGGFSIPGESLGSVGARSSLSLSGSSRSDDDLADEPGMQRWTAAEATHLVPRFLRVGLANSKRQLTIWFCRGPNCHTGCKNGDTDCREESCHAACDTEGRVKGLDLTLEEPLNLQAFTADKTGVDVQALAQHFQGAAKPIDQDVCNVWTALDKSAKAQLLSKVAAKIGDPVGSSVWWHLQGPASFEEAGSEGEPRASTRDGAACVE